MFLPVSLFDLLYLDKMEFPYLRFPALTTNRGFLCIGLLALWRAQWLCGFVSNYFDRLFPKLDPFSTQQRGGSVGNVYG